MALSADDRLAILNLYSRYCHEADVGTGEGWAATYTEAGEIARADPAGEIGDVTGVVKGRKDLAAVHQRFVTANPNYRHWISNIEIEGDGDDATGKCYAMVVEVSPDGVRLVGHGRYRDTLARTADGWRFARRIVTRNS